jgi:hypothetical protein
VRILRVERKMSASYVGGKAEYTKRYHLGETVRDHCRHFLLLSATLAPPLPAEVIRSGMLALSQSILCGLFRRHRHPLGKRCFPLCLAQLGACGGHAALVIRKFRRM